MIDLSLEETDDRSFEESLSSMPWARLMDAVRGVVGPSGRASGRLMTLTKTDDRVTVVWEDRTEQTVSARATVIQFFEASQVDDAMIDSEWTRWVETRRHQVTTVPPGSVLLMTGLPGSGKTTLARSLAETLGMSHLDFARFVKKIVGRHPLWQEDYVRVGLRVDSLLAAYVRHGGRLIYDTTAIDGAIRKHHLLSFPRASARALVWVPTDNDVCRHRLEQRPVGERPDLRPMVRRESPQHARTYQDYVDGFETPHTAVTVSNECPVPEGAERIAKCLWSQL